MRARYVLVDSPNAELLPTACKLGFEFASLPELFTEVQSKTVYVWNDNQQPAGWDKVVALEQLSDQCKLQVVRSAVRPPRQMDALSLVNRSASMFATIRVINDHTDPAIHLEAEVMVDSGCEAELILPKRKMQQLQLDVMDTSRARGFGGAITDMIVYRAVKVEVDLTDEKTGEVLSTRRADLVPQSKSSDPDWVPPHQDVRLHEFAGLRGQAADGGVVKLSPVKRNRADTAGLLGFLALHKLKLRMDPENYQLLRVTEDELIV